ncbi:MAG: hypothetical protein A2W80_19305 [Candidatus Riflebacteria bacterium GWC2_50_8]|nr:MAG: hypothetical protein A2W80_19305 [Candidatus Riflebacteria bacterium GWC2_50_8]
MNFVSAAFTLCVFVGSFLLFMVQPMVGKILLPYLGGVPAVWTTCMLFFQFALLAGYIYAEKSVRYLGCQRQSILHLLLMTGAFTLLPLNIDTSGAGAAVNNPTGWLLARLAGSIGILFFMISANAPLLQRYYSETGQSDSADPYFLYAASNVGSLLALLSYPFVLEPLLRLSQQRLLWSALYALQTILVLICCILLWKGSVKSKVTETDQCGTTGEPGHDNLAIGESATKTVFEERSVSVTKTDRAPEITDVDDLFNNIVREQELATLKAQDHTRPTWKKALFWCLLGFVPCSAMLSVTTHMATDIASAPMLWVFPLALYLVSFVLVFARSGYWRGIKWERYMFPIVVLAMLFYHFRIVERTWLIIPLHLLAMFLICMYFHARLAKERPPVIQLNSYFVWMSVGGILGGIFNGLLAPLFFTTQSEYIVTLLTAACLSSFMAKSYYDPEYSMARRILVAATFMSLLVLPGWLEEVNLSKLLSESGMFMTFLSLFLIYAFNNFRKAAAPLLIVIALTAFMQNSADPRLVMVDRSFFGILRVTRLANDGKVVDPDLKIEGVKDIFYCLSHGTTLHGVERKVDNMRMSYPLAYYAREGPVGSVFRVGQINRAFKNIGVVGLGCGTLAWYGRAWQNFDFFEIDPKVVEIATNPEYFTFLSNSKARIRHIIGDARVSLQNVPDNFYDLLIIDAYSSDAVPVHLMTREAVELYRSKIKQDGMLLFHISNRFFKLSPVIKRICDEIGIACLRSYDEPSTYSTRYDWYDYDQLCRSDWIAAGNPKHLESLKLYAKWDEVELQPGYSLWTDDYANLLQVYMWR